MMSSEKSEVFILFGQSQAVGHAIPMDEKDRIKTPLKNVYGLDREYNQSFNTDRLVWSGYRSAGMNLGEEQDDTYSLANCLAAQWQKKIDEGEKLPDLYIVHIAIGAEGVTEKYLPDGGVEKYMWNPLYEKTLIPGKLGKVKIALYPFALHILSLIRESFAEAGKAYEIMDLYWRGGENDMETPCEILRDRLKATYERMFSGFYEALGGRVPLTLNRILNGEAMMKLDPSGEYKKSMDFINSTFDALSEENGNISVFDCSKAPFYRENVSANGLFIDDLVHYTPETNQWNARVILEDYIKKRTQAAEPQK